MMRGHAVKLYASVCDCEQVLSSWERIQSWRYDTTAARAVELLAERHWQKYGCEAPLIIRQFSDGPASAWYPWIARKLNGETRVEEQTKRVIYYEFLRPLWPDDWRQQQRQLERESAMFKRDPLRDEIEFDYVGSPWR